MKLKDGMDNWCHKGAGLKNLIMDYYQTLFTSQGVDDDVICSLVQKGISKEQNEKLLALFWLQKLKSFRFYAS